MTKGKRAAPCAGTKSAAKSSECGPSVSSMPQDHSRTPLGRLIRVHKLFVKLFFQCWGSAIPHWFANPDPAFYLNADTDTDPDPGRKPNPM